MKMSKLFGAIALGSALTLGLTACDPPMPKSLLVEIAEQSYNCETGTANLALPVSAEDLSLTWGDAMISACADMALQLVNAADSPDLLLDSASDLKCDAFATAPVAVDSAVLAFNVTDVFDLFLDANAILGILNGEVTSWDDPSIYDLNPDQLLPSAPINLIKSAPSADIAAMQSWLSTLLGEEVKITGLTPIEESTVDLLSAMPENSIALVPHSDALFAAASFAAVVTGDDVYESAVIADVDSMVSASTQWVVSANESTVSVELDPSIAPTPPDGVNEAVAPYQAIYPVNMSLCGEDNLLKRAAGRFLLRQDQQGVISVSTLAYLPEEVRIASIDLIGQGLPEPEKLTTEG